MVFFKDEIITQVVSDTGGTASINADSSQYKGIEFMYDWRPLDGLRLSGAYTHIDAKYVNFTDQFLIGGVPTPVVRDGKIVPNVPTDVLNLKGEYDHIPSGWGGWLESQLLQQLLPEQQQYHRHSSLLGDQLPTFTRRSRSKTTSTSGSPSSLSNWTTLRTRPTRRPGNVVSDSTPDASKTLFFAGYGRAFYAGVTLGLF